MIIFGDPTPPATPGIKFAGHVSLRAVIVNNKKPDYGTLRMVQNVKFDWRRSPPLQPDPNKKLFAECAGSHGSWVLDKPISPVITLPGPGTYPIYGKDSPGVLLEQASTAFEHVTATNEFRTYLIHTTHGVDHVLARIDWSWTAEAGDTGSHKGQCTSVTLSDGWYVKKAPPPQASPAIIGAAASNPPPISSPLADTTHWSLCP